jgi:quinolinate synthase
VQHLAMEFAVVGYESESTYDERLPDWEPDTVFMNTGSAIAAATDWLATRSAGLVEIIEVEGDTGEVILLVTDAGIKNIR